MSGFDDMDVDTIWMDGEFVDWDEAQVHVLTHGLHYGSGIFEGIRCYDTEDDPAIFWWDVHLDRFYNSAKPYDLEIDHSREELTKASLSFIDRQNLQSCNTRHQAYYVYNIVCINNEDCLSRTAS